MSDLIVVEAREHGATWVTLNRPAARNALSLAVNRELKELAHRLGSDPSVRSVILTGAGDKAFCAGADLKERKGVSPEDSGPYVDAISGAITAWAEMPVPTLALINGFAFGGGMELALACDFRIASSRASFGLTEVRLGIMPGAGGTQRLTRLVGVAAAKELILLGRRIDAARAQKLGLVMAVCEADALEGAGVAVANELEGCAPRSVAMAKNAIDRGFDLPLREGLEIERESYNVTLFTEDRNEGLRAFAEKRPPNYRGE